MILIVDVWVQLSGVLNHARLTYGLTYRRDNLTHPQNVLHECAQSRTGINQRGVYSR
jgi:hypothetical protein